MDVLELDELPCRVRLVRNPRARRFTLRMDPTGADAILTLPPGVPDGDATSFLQRHRAWLAKAVARQPGFVRVAHGASMPIDGEMASVDVRPGRRRAPQLQGDTLLLQGEGAVGKRIAAWLKLHARDQLQPAAAHYAGLLDRKIAGISLRDTRTRWGSCSSTGALSFSWRLGMAPRAVQEYVAAHEAAHLVEMNHGPGFWALLDDVMPDWRVHRDWLKREGRMLHAYRFNDD